MDLNLPQAPHHTPAATHLMLLELEAQQLHHRLWLEARDQLDEAAAVRLLHRRLQHQVQHSVGVKVKITNQRLRCGARRRRTGVMGWKGEAWTSTSDNRIWQLLNAS